MLELEMPADLGGLFSAPIPRRKSRKPPMRAIEIPILEAKQIRTYAAKEGGRFLLPGKKDKLERKFDIWTWVDEVFDTDDPGLRGLRIAFISSLLASLTQMGFRVTEGLFGLIKRSGGVRSPTAQHLADAWNQAIREVRGKGKSPTWSKVTGDT